MGVEVFMYVGQIGVSIRAHCVDQDGDDIDISEAESLTLHLLTPSGTAKSFTATLVTTGTDGRCEYITAAVSDVDEDGWWTVQPYVITPTKRFPAKKYRFPVRETIY